MSLTKNTILDLKDPAFLTPYRHWIQNALTTVESRVGRKHRGEGDEQIEHWQNVVRELMEHYDAHPHHNGPGRLFQVCFYMDPSIPVGRSINRSRINLTARECSAFYSHGLGDACDILHFQEKYPHVKVPPRAGMVNELLTEATVDVELTEAIIALGDKIPSHPRELAYTCYTLDQLRDALMVFAYIQARLDEISRYGRDDFEYGSERYRLALEQGQWRRLESVLYMAFDVKKSWDGGKPPQDDPIVEIAQKWMRLLAYENTDLDSEMWRAFYLGAMWADVDKFSVEVRPLIRDIFDALQIAGRRFNNR